MTLRRVTRWLLREIGLLLVVAGRELALLLVVVVLLFLLVTAHDCGRPGLGPG